jgi:hypothetical protein
MLVTISLAQTEIREPSVGYLEITADADLVEIYIDGHSLGQTPLENPLVLIPGWYNISFFSPGFKWSHWTHRQRKAIANVIEVGTHHILIRPGERVDLYMEWSELEQRLIKYEQGQNITALVGLTMITSALMLIALAI